MNILAIDTATGIEIVAVQSKNHFFDSTRQVDQSHSVSLFTSIDRALKECKISITDINLIGVGIGPGSFTGIRIAVTTARMLSQVLAIPLVGIKTHILYAAAVTAKPEENILVAFDAKKNRVFGALYKTCKDSLSPFEIVPPGDYPIDFLLQKIDGDRTLLTGDGTIKYYEEISQKIQSNLLLDTFIPSGKIVCRIVMEHYKQSPSTYNDYNIVRPFYARKSDAEIMKVQRGKNK